MKDSIFPPHKQDKGLHYIILSNKIVLNWTKMDMDFYPSANSFLVKLF